LEKITSSIKKGLGKKTRSSSTKRPMFGALTKGSSSGLEKKDPTSPMLRHRLDRSRQSSVRKQIRSNDQIKRGYVSNSSTNSRPASMISGNNTAVRSLSNTGKQKPINNSSTGKKTATFSPGRSNVTEKSLKNPS